MKITDNFLPQVEFEAVRDMLMSPYFEWYYNDYSVYKDQKELPQMIHNFIRLQDGIAGVPSSQYIENLVPFFRLVPDLCTVVRCKANLTWKHHEHVEKGYHVDTERGFDGKTAILYLNDTNGGTKFETGEVVECRANRFVTFDNRIQHSAITCTDENRRVIINLNYTTWK